MKTKLKQAKTFIKKYEQYIVPAMLLGGVVVDFITFTTIELKTVFLLLIAHSLMAATLILVSRWLDEHPQLHTHKPIQWINTAGPLVIQFNFGALLSASFIFYWFSGSFTVSWPILLPIIGLMVANDRFRELYLRPNVQLGVFYFANFSLLSIILPHIFNSISPIVFIIAGVLSYSLMHAYLALLTLFTKNVRNQFSQIKRWILGIFVVMNVLYFLNIIPPIPLTIREAGIYHDLEIQGNNYVLKTEENRLERLIPGQTVHLVQGKPLYAFTSIFSPPNIDTTIVHEWQEYNETTKEWVTRDTLSFDIIGGREKGFRGYTMKTALSQGRWRVNVQTTRGQTLGRLTFKIVFTDEIPALHTIEPAYAP